MAALKDEVKSFIVKALACFDTPSQVEDALDNALGIMHQMKRMEYKGDLDIFDDFGSDAVMATAGPFVLALVQLVNSRLLDKESAFEEMQRYGIINPDKAWKDVQAQLELEPPMFDVSMPDAAPLLGLKYIREAS